MKRSFTFAALCVASFCWAHQPVREDPALRAKVPPVLLLALKAQANLRYSGERVVEFRRGADLIRHTEYVLKAGDKTRVWFPSESQFAGQIIVDNGRERQHFYPNRNEIEVLPAPKEEAFGRVANAIRTGKLSFAVQPGETIAGKPTRLATIKNANGPMMQRLWIDPASGLLLKREVFGPGGQLTGSFAFTRVDLNPKLGGGDFELNIPGAVRRTPEERNRVLANSLGMVPVTLGAGSGFRLESVNVRRAQKVGILHQVYAGPRGKLSLFVVNGTFDLGRFAEKANKEFQFHSWNVSGRSYALVGAYPATLLASLARTLGDR